MGFLEDESIGTEAVFFDEKGGFGLFVKLLLEVEFNLCFAYDADIDKM
jgi:hypothetical protein